MDRVASGGDDVAGLQPSNHSTISAMRGSAFLAVLFGIGGAATPFVMLWFRRRALRQRVTWHRTATIVERAQLRRRGRLSIVRFVLFWLASIGLITAISTLHAPPAMDILALAVILTMVVGLIGQHLGIRCPICSYRLGYQRPLGVPSRCERCRGELGL